MKYILHVGSYDFEIKDSTTASRIAEILKDSFLPDTYRNTIEVEIEFKKEED